MSEGETPGILEASPIVFGLCLASLIRDSIDKDCIFEKSKSGGIVKDSNRFNFFALFDSRSI